MTTLGRIFSGIILITASLAIGIAAHVAIGGTAPFTISIHWASWLAL